LLCVPDFARRAQDKVALPGEDEPAWHGDETMDLSSRVRERSLGGSPPIG
jgi:hypothetical protein